MIAASARMGDSAHKPLPLSARGLAANQVTLAFLKQFRNVEHADRANLLGCDVAVGRMSDRIARS